MENSLKIAYLNKKKNIYGKTRRIYLFCATRTVRYDFEHWQKAPYGIPIKLWIILIERNPLVNDWFRKRMVAHIEMVRFGVRLNENIKDKAKAYVNGYLINRQKCSLALFLGSVFIRF